MTLDDALRALAMALGAFCALSGFAFFAAGLMPGPSAAWWKQYGWSAVTLTAAFYLLSYAFGG